MPHGQCYLWNPSLVSLHAISDGLIALAYYSIPISLTLLVRQRQDLPFIRIFWLFVGFIVACGTTHLLEVWTLWYPAYWLSGVIKAVTAFISLYTAVELLPLIPQIVALPSPAQLAATNQALEHQIKRREMAEQTLQKLNQELEQRVEQRTLELQHLNAILRQQANQQQAIARLGQEALLEISLPELIQHAAKTVATTLQVSHCLILKVLPNQTLQIMAATGWNNQRIGQKIDQQPLIDTALATEEPVFWSGLSQTFLESDYPFFQGDRINAGVSVRIAGKSGPFGILGVYSQDPRNFNHDDALFLQAIVAILSTVIGRQQTEAALKQNEDRLRLALDNSPIAMFSQDLNLQYTWIYNPKHNTQIEDWVGHTDHELMATASPHVIELKQQVLDQGISLRKTVDVTFNGQASTFDLILEPMCEDHEVIGLIGVAVDITELQRIERVKDEFLSVVSHELRTPLSSLHGSLTLLATGRLGTLESKGQRLLEIAVNNTDRLVRLVSDILDLERLEAGKLRIEKQHCNAAELITQAIETMQPMAQKAKVMLRGSLQSVEFWADPDRILQVLTNLLSNAIKFSPPDSIVQVDACYELDTMIQFRVEDQGRGIPKDQWEAIFERFQQVDASDARQKGGTGLGLPICKTIVRQHGGQIWVKSKLGHGSRFYFTLPIEPEADDDNDA